VLINSQGEYFSLFDLILPDVQNFGCCVNVPINYMDANNTALGDLLFPGQYYFMVSWSYVEVFLWIN